MLRDYVAVDLEMTGLNPKEERILEIGAVKFLNGSIAATYSRLVNPHRALSEKIIGLTGITQQEADKGVEDVEAVREFLAFSEDLPLVGHHVISDFSFIKYCAAKEKLSVQKQAVDTLHLTRRFMPELEKKNLEAVCAALEIKRENGHRALDDAKASAEVLAYFQKRYEGDFPEAFLPKELIYHVKKQSPATPRQKKNLRLLADYHKIELEWEIDALTKSEASRITDRIIARYGRIPKGGV